MSGKYIMEDSLFAEQHNTLIMIDEIVGRADLAMKPSFELLGGTALLLHGIEAVFTVDIDVANAQSDQIKSLVEPFISDMASEVATLPAKYKERMRQYGEGDFENIEVFLISIEDLVVTKLGAWRVKDREDLTKTGVMKRCDRLKLNSIINTEFDARIAKTLLTRLASI